MGLGMEEDIEVGALEVGALEVGALHSPQQLLVGLEQAPPSIPSPSKGGSKVNSLPEACRLRDAGCGGGSAVKPMGIALLHRALSLKYRPPAMIEKVSALLMERKVKNVRDEKERGT